MSTRERETALGLEPGERPVEIESVPGAINDEMNRLDPEFAMAWAELAVVQRQLGQNEEAEESIRRAYEARLTATEVEILRALIARRGEVVSRDELLKEIEGDEE